MPWNPHDGPERHTKKANTPARKRQWADVANRVLADSGDEGRAVREANAVVAKAHNTIHPDAKTMHAGQERFQRHARKPRG